MPCTYAVEVRTTDLGSFSGIKEHCHLSLNETFASHRCYRVRNAKVKIDHIDLDKFQDFCEIDLQLTHRTALTHASRIRSFLRHSNRNVVSIDDIRGFLKFYKDTYATSYGGMISSLKRFFRDYLNAEYMVKTFKHPTPRYELKVNGLSKEQLRTFYEAIKRPKHQAYFLLLATSGLRKGEALSLTIHDVDFQRRMIVPKNHNGCTKHSYASFFSRECADVLEPYLRNRNSPSKYLFPNDRTRFHNVAWRAARRITGIDTTPKILREWFCNEMGRLGVPDRYIDAFCGRVPKSILARHYTDYSPERLKRIYDKANLRVLS